MRKEKRIERNGAEIVVTLEKAVKEVENLADHNITKTTAVCTMEVRVFKAGKLVLEIERYRPEIENRISPETIKIITGVFAELNKEVIDVDYDTQVKKENEVEEKEEKEYAAKSELAKKVRKAMNADERIGE